MSKLLSFTVNERNDGVRIDTVVAENADDLTRSAVQRLAEDNLISVNGKNVRKNYKCKSGDSVCVTVPDVQPLEVEAQNIPLDIVYEDDDLIVVNKPKGMVVHPAPGNRESTLVNALMYHCADSLSGINGVMRPGIVHRIDKDTSGLLIVAKNDKAHIFLARQIKEHTFSRAYEAVVYGNVKQDKLTIDKPIGRNPADRKKMAVTYKNSRNAVTHIEVIERFDSFTHIRCTLETGRTHQIRVHMASIGHPIAGDAVYGPKKVITSLSGQCLHAKHIGFIHPTTLQKMEFESELPEYFTSFLNKLNKKAQ